VTKLTAVITEAHPCCQLHTKILFNILLPRLTPYANEITGDHQCGFQHNTSKTSNFLCPADTGGKNGSILVQCINYLWISRKPMIWLGGKYDTLFSLSL
jgi:hypothetical protein